MKQIVYYECEVCKRRSENCEDILACEAAHKNLSVSENQEYDLLKRRVISAGYEVSFRANDNTRKAFDEAIDELLKFEKKHGIGGKTNE